MSAKGFTIMTFGGMALIGLAVAVFVLMGLDWSGGNEGIYWIFFLMGTVYLIGFVVYYKKWRIANWMGRYLTIVEKGVTEEEGLEIMHRYSFLLLIGSVLLYVAGVAAIFVY